MPPIARLALLSPAAGFARAAGTIAGMAAAAANFATIMGYYSPFRANVWVERIKEFRIIQPDQMVVGQVKDLLAVNPL